MELVILITDSLHPWYSWSTGDTTRLIIAKNEGTYVVKAGIPFCYGTDSVRVSWMNISKPFIGLDTAMCGIDSFKITTNKSYENYNWSTTQKTRNIHVYKTGSYSIEVDSAGCSNFDTINVKMTHPPNGFSLGNDKEFCEGDSVLLKPDNYLGSLVWSTGDTSKTLQVNKAGEYSLTMNYDKCQFKTSLNVSMNVYPTITLENDTFFCQFTELQLNSSRTNSNSQLWSTGSISESIVIFEAGDYWATTKNSCGTASDTISITEKNCECVLEIPNVFTPNNDGVNDLFYLNYTCPFDKYQIDIYNRWGRKMFTSTDFNQDWDGKVNGKTVTAGVYFWVLHYQFPYGGEETTMKGEVTVLIER